jgi:flagellar operon protein (TIGR03826 family)
MAAQLVNCRKCGKLFLRIKNVCEECYKKQEDDFKSVTDYLRDFPGSTIHELSEATGVSIGQIREYILANRILASNFMNISYPCETCSSLIQTGKICSNCQDTLNKLAKKMEQKVTNRVKEKTGKSGGYITRDF